MGKRKALRPGRGDLGQRPLPASGFRPDRVSCGPRGEGCPANKTQTGPWPWPPCPRAALVPSVREISAFCSRCLLTPCVLLLSADLDMCCSFFPECPSCSFIRDAEMTTPALPEGLWTPGCLRLYLGTSEK